MHKLLQLLFDKSVQENLGSDVWYPLPSWLRVYFRTMSPARQVLTYARLMKGRDLSHTVDNEVGCAESVTRILTTLFPHCHIITGTWTLLRFLQMSKHFMEVSKPVDGAIAIAATGTGNGRIPNGHVGIVDGSLLWNNSSSSGKWGLWYTMRTFVHRYQVGGGMRVYYFLPVKK